MDTSTFHFLLAWTRSDRLKARIQEVWATRARYGYPRVGVLLKREGWAVNHKRTDKLGTEAAPAEQDTKRRVKANCSKTE